MKTTATYIKVSDKVVSVTGMKKPYQNESFNEAIQAFESSFIEVSNKDVILQMWSEITGSDNDVLTFGIYPIQGIEFEVRPKTWDDEGIRCDECCNGDRCDEPSHQDRKSCTYCKGTGRVNPADKRAIVSLISPNVSKPEKEYTYVVFEKSVMNMYVNESDAVKLVKELNDKNVDPDTSYSFEKIQFLTKDL